jgi:integrase
MGRLYNMSWEPAKKRWRKVVGPKVYTVTCRALGCPATKEASYMAANRWWTAKQAELEGHEGTLVQNIKDMLAKGNRDLTIAKRIGELISLLEHPELPDPEPAPLPDTLGSLVAHWLDTLRTRVNLGKTSAARYGTIHDMILRFQSFAGELSSVSVLNEQMIERYYFDLARMSWSEVTKSHHMSVVKQFLRYCYGQRMIELPRNMTDPALRFKTHAQKIDTFTVDEVKSLLARAKGQHKLHILLALNCGYGAGDISQLRQEEVDWEQGRIVRKRSKTRHHENVPEVSYRLWQPTLALLRQYDSGTDPVLQTATGGEWAFRRLRQDGTIWRKDAVSPPFLRVLGACGLAGRGLSHYSLRKTSASILNSHEHFGRYASHFLGHTPSGTTAKYYAAPSPELFDRILAWLGEQYGM